MSEREHTDATPATPPPERPETDATAAGLPDAPAPPAGELLKRLAWVVRAGQADRPDPVPEQRPWETDADAAGWQTVHRGTGRRRAVTSVLVVELDAEQDAWLDQAAGAAGLTPDALLRKLIDDARAGAAA